MDVQKLLRKRKPKGEDFARLLALKTVAGYDVMLQYPQLQALAKDDSIDEKANQWAATATAEDYKAFTDFLTMFDWVKKEHNEAKTHTIRAAIAFNNLIQAMLGVNTAERTSDYLEEINAPMEGDLAVRVQSSLNSIALSYYVEDSAQGRGQLRNTTITRLIMHESMYFVKAYNTIIEEIANKFDFEELRVMQTELTVGEHNFKVFNDYKEEFKIYLLERQRLKQAKALDFVFPDLFVEESDMTPKTMQLLKKKARNKESYRFSEIRSLCDKTDNPINEQELEDYIIEYNRQ